MSYLAAFLYVAGCLAVMQYADVLKDKPGPTLGLYVYVLGWPLVVPTIWLVAFIDAVRK